LIFVAAVFVLLTLILYEWSGYPYLVANADADRWVPITSGVSLAAILLAGMARGWRAPLATVAVVLAVIYGLSLRELVLNPQSGELQTAWLGYPISSVTLHDFNDRPYCYRQTLFTIELQQQGPEPTSIAYFRGIWPSVLQASKLTFERCSH
jgi:hypothetical protein